MGRKMEEEEEEEDSIRMHINETGSEDERYAELDQYHASEDSHQVWWQESVAILFDLQFLIPES